MSARIVRLPGLPPKGDVSDFLNAGGTVEELKRLAEGAPPEQTQEAPTAEADAGRSSLLIDDYDLLEMTAEAWRAVEVDGDIYKFGTALGRVVTDEGEDRARTQLLTRHQLRYRLAERIQFLREAGKEVKPAFPPETLVITMLNVPPPSLPRLLRVVHAPIFVADGRLLQTPGYDAASGVYLALRPGLDIPPVPSTPTPEDVAEAKRWLLEELLGDVPFVSDADRANAVSTLLTLVLREMIPGNVPLFAFSKPQPRSGATLCVQLLTLIVLGVEAPPTRATPDKNEMEKKLLAILEGTPEVVFFDNVHGRLNNETLNMVTTSPTFQGRRLQYTQLVHVPMRAVFCITGNNLEMSHELTARSVFVRIDPKMERPWERQGFRHPFIRQWARENRGQLLWAALTLSQAWIAAGRPTVVVERAPAFGGFEEWEMTLRGVLQVAGISGFRANQDELFERMDQESAPTREFLAKWWAAFKTTRRTVKELITVAVTVDGLPIEARDEQGQRTRLGMFLGSQQDRPFTIAEGLVVKIVRDGKGANAILWRLEPTAADPDQGVTPGETQANSADPKADPQEGGTSTLGGSPLLALAQGRGKGDSKGTSGQVRERIGENTDGVSLVTLGSQPTRARGEPSGQTSDNSLFLPPHVSVAEKANKANKANSGPEPTPCGRVHEDPAMVLRHDYPCPCARCCEDCNMVLDLISDDCELPETPIVTPPPPTRRPRR